MNYDFYLASLPADAVDAALTCGFVAATAFVLALRWALEWTAPVDRGGDYE